MDAGVALAELVELSSQVEQAAILDGGGAVQAATPLGERLAPIAVELLKAAGDVRSGVTPTRVEVALPEGSVFVVREGDRSAVATAVAEATAGLVVYDLRSCLHRLEEADPHA